MMNRFYFILLFLLSFNEFCFAQCSGNLIRNASFEHRGALVGLDRPSCPAEADKLQWWEDRKKQKVDLNLLAGSECNGNPAYHSPDWFKNDADNDNDGFFRLDETVGILPGFTYTYDQKVPANNGSHYIGMLRGELIQQKLESNLEIEKDYIISLYIRQFFGMAQWYYLDGYPFVGIFQSASYYDFDQDEWVTNYWDENTDNATVKVYISKQQIKYSDEESWNTDKANPEDIYEVLSVDLHPSSDGTLYWRNLKGNFTVPGDGYNWIAIELHSNTQSYYIAIDDASLVKGCIEECSRTDECMQPVFSEYCGSIEYIAEAGMGVKITKTTQLKISSLANAKKANLIIEDVQHQVVFSKTLACDNGLDGPIFWDGKNNNNAYVSDGFYSLQLTLENDCGTEEFELDILKDGDYNFNNCPLVFDFYCNEYNVVTPEPCCSTQPNIYLNNITIGAAGTTGILEYKAINNIYIGENVTITEGSNVLFQAGNEIIGDPFEEVEIGAFVTAEIVPCPSQRLGQFNDEESETVGQNVISQISLDTDSSEKLLETIPKEIPLFTLQPNPTANGEFMLSVTNIQAVIYDVVIYNTLGETVYKSTILEANTPLNISSYPKGIYFVKVENGEGEMTVQKVVSMN